jgi:putative nucleotidyltransferase with HDIG domain
MELGSWAHLIGRFFQVVTAGPLTDGERRQVETWLDDEGESAVYWEQPVPDQRHGLESARLIATTRPDRRDLIRAGLLHDIGKRHSELGAVGRSLASLFAKLRVPVRGSWRRYLDHGALGAEELTRLGSGELSIEFARHHHQQRPATISEDDWELLQSADR